MHFVTCPKQGREMEVVVLHRVGFLAYSCPKQGEDFKPSAAPLYPNMGQVAPWDSNLHHKTGVIILFSHNIHNPLKGDS